MKNIISINIVVRIDAEYDTARHDARSAAKEAAIKVISDARAHVHTVENGIRIIDIENCGESI